MMVLLRYLVPPLILTEMIELAVGGILIPKRRFLETVLIMNAVTNPLMNLMRILIYQCTGWNYGVIPVAEAAVWLYETEYIKGRHHWSGRKAMGVSLLLNACSFLFGVVFSL